jgi:hypothetical protein
MGYTVTTGRGIQLEKAYFRKHAGGDPIPVMFNPTDLSIAKPIGWNPQDKTKQEKGPALQFTGAQARTTTIKLEFDTSGFDGADGTSDASDVRDFINPLLAWTDPTEKRTEKNMEPPVLDFEWGAGFKMTCVITNATVNFKKFNPDGVPIRADLSLALLEVLNQPINSNLAGGQVITTAPGPLSADEASAAGMASNPRTPPPGPRTASSGVRP